MIKKVTIDYEKLCEELNRQGKTKQGFSIEIGRGKDYIVSIKHRPEQQIVVPNVKPGNMNAFRYGGTKRKRKIIKRGK
mgnify:CR=1 FL=1